MYNRKQLRRFLPGGVNDTGSWDFSDGNFNFDMNLGNINDPYDVDQNIVPDNIQSNSLNPVNPYNSNVSNIMNYNSNAAPSNSIVPFNLDTPDKMPTLKPTLMNQKKDSGLVAVESRKMKNWNPEKMVNKFNAATRGVLGITNNFQNRAEEQAQILKTVNPVNFVNTQYSKYRGNIVDAGSKLGLASYDQMGSDRNSYGTYGDFGGNEAQLGGFLQNGGTNGHKIGDEVTMSIPELEQFLAAGGEVDYI